MALTGRARARAAALSRALGAPPPLAHTRPPTSRARAPCRLDGAGYGIGQRFHELTAFRERPGRRESGLVPMLQFVSHAVWTALFGRPADALEKSTDKAHTYMIRDDEPLVGAFISVPRDMSRFNPASFMGGILRGVLDGAGFPCTVQAVTVAAPEGAVRDRVVFVVTFDEAIAAREG